MIVAGSGPRSVVTTASYEARRFGVGSAIPAARARQLCPQGVFLPPDFPYYKSVSRKVMAIVRANVETVEVIGFDEAYLDLSGFPAPKACMRRIVHDIKQATGLDASVGIGPNKLVAKVASDAEKPRGFVVLSAEMAQQRFADASVRLIPGIGGKTAERLHGLGIETVGDLAAASDVALTAVFTARTAAHLKALAHFEHNGLVTQERKVVSESRELTFDTDIMTQERLAAVLTKLVHELCETLEQQGQKGRTIGIKVRLDDFSTHTRSKTLSVAVNSAADVEPIARELLQAFGMPRPVRLLGVRVAGLGEQVRSKHEQLVLAL